MDKPASAADNRAMRVSLTGAGGFVGSFTCQALHAGGHEVRALIRPGGRRDHIEAFVDEIIEGEQHEPLLHHRMTENVDVVIHNAVDWEALRKSPREHFEKNLLGSLDLLESSRLAGVRQFIFVSSVAVHHEIITSPTIVETHPTWPAGLYGACKAAVESHLKAYHHAYGMNTSAWRPAAIYGMDPKPERRQWRELIQNAAAGQTIEIQKGGKITHVQDVADALTLAVGDDEVAGEFFNLAEMYLYWQQVAEEARQLSGSAADIVDRKGDGPKNHFSPEKARQFFDRHGNTMGMRRGMSGVRTYVQQMLEADPAS